MPPDTLPGADELWVMCTVTDQQKSTSCRFYMPIANEDERLKAGTELGYLDAHPFPIPGAAAGSEVKVYVRLDAVKSPNGDGYRVSAPEGAFASAAGPQIADPVWVYSPADEWASQFTAETAVREEKRGRATVRCVATDRGALVNCWSPRESPAGWGFAESAMKLLAHAQMRPLSASDHPVSGRPYEVTIIF